MNFLDGIPQEYRDYVLSFIFEESSNYSTRIVRAGITLTTKNNTYCGIDYYDGENRDTFANLGFENVVTLKPEKFHYITDNEKCRGIPYNKIVYEKISDDLKANCSKACRLPNYYMCEYFMKAVGHLPLCKTEQEDPCFTRAKQEAIKDIQKQNLHKPCTKLQYKYDSVVWPNSPYDNQAKFKVKFMSPARVKVKQEYLIYDAVSMISAIGGTLGLCIGFSFREVSGVVLGYLEVGINRILSCKAQDKVNSMDAKNYLIDDLRDCVKSEVKKQLERQDSKLFAAENTRFEK